MYGKPNPRDLYTQNVNFANEKHDKRIMDRQKEIENDRESLKRLNAELEEEKKFEKNKKKQIQNQQLLEYQHYMQQKYSQTPQQRENIQIKIGGENRILHKKNYNAENENLVLNPMTDGYKQSSVPVQNYSEYGRQLNRGSNRGYNILTGESFQKTENNVPSKPDYMPQQQISEPNIPPNYMRQQQTSEPNISPNYMRQQQILEQNIPPQNNYMRQQQIPEQNIPPEYQQNIPSQADYLKQQQMYEQNIPNQSEYNKYYNQEIPSQYNMPPQYSNQIPSDKLNNYEKEPYVPQKIEGIGEIPKELLPNTNSNKEELNVNDEDYRLYQEYLMKQRQKEQSPLPNNTNLEPPQQQQQQNPNYPPKMIRPSQQQQLNENYYQNQPKYQPSIPHYQPSTANNNINPNTEKTPEEIYNEYMKSQYSQNEYIPKEIPRTQYNNNMPNSNLNPYEEYLYRREMMKERFNNNNIPSQYRPAMQFKPPAQYTNEELTDQMRKLSLRNETRNEYMANKNKNVNSYTKITSIDPLPQQPPKYTNEPMSEDKKLERQRQYKEYLDQQLNAKQIYKDTMNNLKQNAQLNMQINMNGLNEGNYSANNNNGNNPYKDLREKNNKFSEVAPNPFTANRNYNFGDSSNLKANPITNPVNSYTFNDRRIPNDRLQNIGNNVVKK